MRVVEAEIRRHIVRKKLKDNSLIVTDKQVEAEIEATQKRVGINRDTLIQYLEGQSISFRPEYYEMIRSSIEYSIFVSRFIAPTIAVSEQEVKNAYLKKNVAPIENFSYSLVEFHISKDSVPKDTELSFLRALKTFQRTGHLPNQFISVETQALGENLSEEELTEDLQKALHNVQEGSFTPLISKGESLHTYFVKKKERAPSQSFLKERVLIRQKLIMERADKVITAIITKLIIH